MRVLRVLRAVAIGARTWVQFQLFPNVLVSLDTNKVIGNCFQCHCTQIEFLAGLPDAISGLN